MNFTTSVTEIAPDTYRISTYHAGFGIQFNQFLVVDDEPFLMHTGFRRMFPATLAGVSQLIDPSRLRWIGYSHFEPDECGALNDWLATAPQAQAICSQVGAMVMLADFADRAPRALADGETMSIGRHRLKFIATPHLPHGWDAGLFLDEATRTLFCSDLFFQPADPPPICESGFLESAREAIRAGQAGPLANDVPYTPYTDATMRRLADLKPEVFAVMHGSSFRGDGRGALLGLADTMRELLAA
jgi:flavorubredoxin